MSGNNRRRENNRHEQDAARRAEYEKARVIRAARERAKRERRRQQAQKKLMLLTALCLVVAAVMILCIIGLFKLAMPRSADVDVGNTVNDSALMSSAETDAVLESKVPESEQPSYTSPTEQEIPPWTHDADIAAISFSRDGKSASLSGTVRCEFAILADVSAKRIVASCGSDKRVYPASLTKVMSLVTAYEHVRDIDRERITMTYDILNPLIISGNSLAGFEVGESASVREYMYGMIMPSGADAAEAIAIYCGGSIAGFADMMNKKAAEIGMRNSHFSNPVGDFSENNYSTVYDLSVLLAYAYQYSDLADILNTYQHTTPPTEYHPDGIYFESNLQQRMKGDESGTCNVLGGKTGYTSEAGHCVMCYAMSKKDGKAYIFVSCKGKAMYDPINDCIDVLKKYVD